MFAYVNPSFWCLRFMKIMNNFSLILIWEISMTSWIWGFHNIVFELMESVVKTVLMLCSCAEKTKKTIIYTFTEQKISIEKTFASNVFRFINSYLGQHGIQLGHIDVINGDNKSRLVWWNGTPNFEEAQSLVVVYKKALTMWASPSKN